jgi:hypothetical protein
LPALKFKASTVDTYYRGLPRSLADHPYPGLSLGERLTLESGMIEETTVDGKDSTLTHAISLAADVVLFDCLFE